jgi:hypothetical protein
LTERFVPLTDDEDGRNAALGGDDPAAMLIPFLKHDGEISVEQIERAQD